MGRKQPEHPKDFWHEHFIPSLIAGLAIGLVVFSYDTTVANVLFFASVGASAVILTNSSSHHLVRLRTALIAYFLLVLSAPFIQFASQQLGVHDGIAIGTLVFGLSLGMYWFNAFHPPVISAAIAFIFFEGGFADLLVLFSLVVVMFICIRFMMYVAYQHFSPKEFWQEFKLAIHR